MVEQRMIELTRITREAWADVGKSEWFKPGADARQILRMMQVETVYVNPADVIAVQPLTVRTGWDESRMERPCRNVGKEQPWWVDEPGSLVHVRQVGKWTVTEEPCVIRWKVEGAA